MSSTRYSSDSEMTIVVAAFLHPFSVSRGAVQALFAAKACDNGGCGIPIAVAELMDSGVTSYRTRFPYTKAAIVTQSIW